MSPGSRLHRLGFFTRLLDDAEPAERYRLATAQIVHAERLGFDTAWVGQHHFHAHEGGLPAPFVFLAHVAAATTRIRLGTGVVTLPLESPLRVAEDAAVLDLLSDGRLELGVGSGGNPAAFMSFGQDEARRPAIFGSHLSTLLAALEGQELPGGDRLHPAGGTLRDRLWCATFSVDGARAAGRLGAGLLLSRTQPRPPGAPALALAGIQEPMIEGYLAALPPGLPPRILASRTVFVADSRGDALRFADTGLRRHQHRLAAAGRGGEPDAPLETLIARQDVHLGTPEEVVESLRADRVVRLATDLAVQVHAVDPPHPFILRSIELVAQHVGPALGWRDGTPARRVA